jgi:tetratricopeptide (TPR) repeat protein
MSTTPEKKLSGSPAKAESRLRFYVAGILWLLCLPLPGVAALTGTVVLMPVVLWLWLALEFGVAALNESGDGFGLAVVGICFGIFMIQATGWGWLVLWACRRLVRRIERIATNGLRNPAWVALFALPLMIALLPDACFGPLTRVNIGQTFTQKQEEGRIDEAHRRSSELANRARRHAMAGDLKEAEADYRQVFALNSQLSPHGGEPLAELAWVLQALGKSAEAESLMRKRIVLLHLSLPQDGSARTVGCTLSERAELAELLACQGKDTEAVAILENLVAASRKELLERQREFFGESGRFPFGEFQNLATCLRLLAGELSRQGKFAEAELAIKEAGVIHAQIKDTGLDPYGFEEDLALFGAMIAHHLRDRGDLNAAAARYQEELGKYPNVLPQYESIVARLKGGYAECLLRQGQAAEALPVALEALELLERNARPAHPAVAGLLETIGRIQDKLGHRTESETALTRARMLRGVQPAAAQ